MYQEATSSYDRSHHHSKTQLFQQVHGNSKETHDKQFLASRQPPSDASVCKIQDLTESRFDSVLFASALSRTEYLQKYGETSTEEDMDDDWVHIEEIVYKDAPFEYLELPAKTPSKKRSYLKQVWKKMTFS